MRSLAAILAIIFCSPGELLAYEPDRPIMRPRAEALAHGMSKEVLDRDQEWYAAWNKWDKQVDADNREHRRRITELTGSWRFSVVVAFLSGVVVTCLFCVILLLNQTSLPSKGTP